MTDLELDTEPREFRLHKTHFSSQPCNVIKNIYVATYTCHISFVLSQILLSLTNYYKNPYSFTTYELYIIKIFLIVNLFYNMNL
jgi:hypothetical protein